MKRHMILICFLCMAALLICSPAFALNFVDANGRNITIEHPQRVVALYGSYGEVWRIAGGTLVGTTSDLAEAGNDATLLGSHTEPNMELLFSLNPDFVILSADTAEHLDIAQVLEDAGITCAFFSYQDFHGYMDMIRLFTQITGRDDLYAEQEERVETPILAMVGDAAELVGEKHPTALLLRAYSTGVRAKGNEGTVAGCILRDMGFDNLADGNSPLAENLSMEAILLADPDYIFVTTMGSSTEAALESMAKMFTDNPAWAGLSAVKHDRYFVLEKELFHEHPNDRWAEAYEIILNILRVNEQ